MIKPYQFAMPVNCHVEVVGFLYEADDPADLGQDMIEVRLANGITIDAGWYPEGDRTGSYVVKAWHPRGVEFPHEVFSNVSDAASAINRLIASDPQVPADCATPSWPVL